MEIGIGLPNAARGVARDGIVEWARRAEEAGFSSLGTIDRIAYPNYASLIALAAAAAVTERIRTWAELPTPPRGGGRGDGADPARDGHPDRAPALDPRPAGQAGGHDRLAVRRAGGARPR